MATLRLMTDAGSNPQTDAEESSHAPADRFADLYEKHRTRVYWYLRAYVPSDEDAADLTQQTFARAYASLDQYRPEKGAFAAWITRIARNLAIDFHRNDRSVTADDWIPSTSSDSVEHDVLIREDLRIVARLIAELPTDKRELLALHYGAGLTAAEIAGVLGKKYRRDSQTAFSNPERTQGALP